MSGTVKLECIDKEGDPVILELFDTLHIPQAKVCLFSLQEMRKAHYRVVQQQNIGTEWIQNERGRFVGSMSEDGEGRAVFNCKTLLPLVSPPPPMLLPIKEEDEEAMVAAVDIELLH